MQVTVDIRNTQDLKDTIELLTVFYKRGMEKDLHNKPLTAIVLPTRAVNTLMVNNIHTLGDLCSKTELYLLRYVPNLGKQTINLVKDNLAMVGLSLAKEDK